VTFSLPLPSWFRKLPSEVLGTWEKACCKGMTKARTYLVNEPLQVAGMSADDVRGWEIVRKMNIWPRSEASRANMKFWGQSLSQGHYQPTYQQARKGFTYFITLALIFISYLNRLQKASVNLTINWRDCWERVNLNGLTIFPLWLDQNLAGCDVN